MKLKKRIYSFDKVPSKEGTLLQESTNIKSRLKSFDEKELFKRKFVDYYLGKNSGMIMILPKGQQILNILIELIKKRIVKKLGFEEYSFPKLVTPMICHRARIVGKWDDYLLSVKPYKFTKGTKETHLLDPLQCTVFYAYLANRVLKEKDLPLKVFDNSGPTYRNEDKVELHPLIKQLEFRRFESVYFGYKEDIIKIRENLFKEIEKLLFKLKIPFRRVIGSGCYDITSDLVRFPESIETMPVVDLELYLPTPFNKRGKKIHYLEVVGGSILRDQQTTRFNIKTSKKALWSGCVGIGLNRLLYSFFANNGYESEKWPEIIKRYLK